MYWLVFEFNELSSLLKLIIFLALLLQEIREPLVISNPDVTRWSCWSKSRGGYGDAGRAGAALLWSQAERAGLVQLGEEKAP